MFLHRLLEPVGFALREEINGRRALDVCETWRPHMILMDIVMPVMDGITMLGKLRKDTWGKTANIILLTNLSDAAETVATSLEMGVYEYLVKSDWRLDDIAEKIKKKLK